MISIDDIRDQDIRFSCGSGASRHPTVEGERQQPV
jgi:hypothetical protein